MILNKDELKAFVAHLFDPATFYRKHPVPSMPANHEKYQADGRYWEGGVWAPTNYMIIKGLQRNGLAEMEIRCAYRLFAFGGFVSHGGWIYPAATVGDSHDAVTGFAVAYLVCDLCSRVLASFVQCLGLGF